MTERAETHLAVVALLKFFEWEHLPPHLQVVSKPFWEMAKELATTLPSNAEATVALRKLLEAKDCAVRSKLSDK